MQRARDATSRPVLSDVNREVRGPLDAIIGYSELLAEDLETLELYDLAHDVEKIRPPARPCSPCSTTDRPACVDPPTAKGAGHGDDRTPRARPNRALAPPAARAARARDRRPAAPPDPRRASRPDCAGHRGSCSRAPPRSTSAALREAWLSSSTPCAAGCSVDQSATLASSLALQTLLSIVPFAGLVLTLVGLLGNDSGRNFLRPSPAWRSPTPVAPPASPTLYELARNVTLENLGIVGFFGSLIGASLLFLTLEARSTTSGGSSTAAAPSPNSRCSTRWPRSPRW
jgi:hypothetical protein